MDKPTEIYNYLLENCIGYENRIKSDILMSLFSIKDNKTFRSYIEKARLNPEFDYLIGSEAGSNGGYWIVTNQQEKNLTTKNLIARAVEMIKTAKAISGKRLYEKK